MKRRGYVASGGSLLVTLTAGCAGWIPSQAEPTPAPGSDEWTPKPSVEGSMAVDSASTLIVTDHSFALAGDDVRVRARVQNTADAAQSVTVTVALFQNADGPAVARGEEERDGLAPGAQETFAVVFGRVNAQEVTRYTVRTG